MCTSAPKPERKELDRYVLIGSSDQSIPERYCCLRTSFLVKRLRSHGGACPALLCPEELGRLPGGEATVRFSGGNSAPPK